MQNSKLLLEGQIEAEDFLNRIVYQQSTDDFGLMDIGHLNVFVDEADDERDDFDEVVSTSSETSEGNFTSSSSSSSKFGQCIVCSDNEPQICILPCFEFCVCETCWDIIKSNSTDLRCPKCKQIAKDGRKMSFAI